MPAAFTPPTITRLTTRALRLTSRHVTTTDRLGRRLAYASAKRTAISGVTSTFHRPLTPRSPKRPRAPPDSHTMEDVTMAPGSTVLNGYTRTSASRTAPSPIRHSSATTTPSSSLAPNLRSVFRPTTHPRRLADAPTYA